MNDLTFTDADLIYDLDADGTAESNFIPIGGRTAAGVNDDSRRFYGNFNGGNHVIYNLSIHDVSLHRTGLFGIAGGTATYIKNLGLENIDMSGECSIGGLIGSCYPTNINISNCYVAGGTINDVGGSSNNFGGLIGYINGQCTVNKCFVRDVAVITNDGFVGGLIGDIWLGSGMTISNCYTSNCTISGNGSVGGLIGSCGASSSGGNATIFHCYSTSTVTRTSGAAATFGGLIGSSSTTPTIIDGHYITTWSPQGLPNNVYGAAMIAPTMRGSLRSTLDAGQTGTWFSDGTATWGNGWHHNYGYPVLGMEPVLNPYVIKDGETVDVNDDDDYAARPSNISIEEGGSLVNYTVNPFVDVKVGRNLRNEQWTFVGSPFGDITAGEYVGGTGYNNIRYNLPMALLRFDTTTNMWANNTDPANPSYNQLGLNSIMETGHGYFAYVFDPGYTSSLVRPAGTIISQTMTATVFNSNFIDVAMTNNGTTYTYEANNAGSANNALWYPLANPYPGTLYASLFIADNTAELSSGYCYLFDFSVSQAWSPSNSAGIPVGYSFFVSGNGGVNQRTHTFRLAKTQIQGGAKKSAVSRDNITITSTANSVSQEACIALNEDASNGFDFHDAYKMLGMNDFLCEPYFIVDSSMIDINSISVLPYECPMNISS
jgi:hypothetical protein